MFPYDLVFTLGVLAMFLAIVTVTSVASLVRERLQARHVAAADGAPATPAGSFRRAA
jgi:hypothetical protein